MSAEKSAASSPALANSEQSCLTRFELAALLNVSVRTVDRMIAARELPVRRVRGHVRFLRSDVDRYLQGDASRTGQLTETDLPKTNPAPTAP